MINARNMESANAIFIVSHSGVAPFPLNLKMREAINTATIDEASASNPPDVFTLNGILFLSRMKDKEKLKSSIITITSAYPEMSNIGIKR